MFSGSICHISRMQQEQFKEEIVPLRGQLLAVARRMLGDPEEAGDIVQETFLKLWMMRERLPEIRNVQALSVTVTKNLCLNRIETRKRAFVPLDGKSPPRADDDPHLRLEHRDSFDRTMRIIDSLPGLQQAILRMKHIEGMEVEEIAEITGSNPEAVRMNLSRARRKVKDIFMKTEK